MTSQSGPQKNARNLRWHQVLLVVVVTLAWGVVSRVYEGWAARREYDNRYSKLLELPGSVSRPKAYFRRMPGVYGKALWVDFYQPNPGEDDKLRAWFVQHGHFGEFKSIGPNLPKPIASWEAERGAQSLIISRVDEDDWVHLNLGERMPPVEAARDLATFPWDSERQTEHDRRAR